MHAVLLALTVFFLAASAQTTCGSPNMLDLSLCPSASEGAFCLTAADAGQSADTCGCKQDADCFNAAAFPKCSIKGNGGSCDFCYTVLPSTSNRQTDVSTVDHQFCRFRFPSKYYLSPPPEFAAAQTTLPSAEQVASATTPNGYFREVCNRNTAQGGACEGCQQASKTNTPEIASLFPTYPAGFLNLGMFGSVHCKHVYNAPGNLRPICAFRNGFFDSVFVPSMWTTLTADNIIGEGGGVTGPSHSETRPISQWQGACFPCLLGGQPRHGLCARIDPTFPICKSDGSCGKCGTNADCQTGGANCLTTGQCTGTYGTAQGLNCMANGECKSCASDADCGTLDGGETINQATCVSGVCSDLPPCASNADCPANTNCNKDGKCVACTAGTGCRTNDGPPGTNANGVSGQPVCVSGVCQDCTLNSECAGTGGANCEANGRCENCGNQLAGSQYCGNADGGAATPATIADANGQTLCNTNTQICETACTSNNFCGLKGGSDAFTRGANCQASGICKDCTVTPDTCGSLDGGENPGETQCDTTLKLCINPFSCATNADCTGTANSGGNNCQTNGNCVSCVVTYTTTTCGPNNDGGETPNQPNCDQSSRQCIRACNNNQDCVPTQGDNCMANGVCFDCRNDADCQTGNPWNGDNNGQTVCSGTLCIDACNSNADCQSGENCMKNGHCIPCTNDADCVSNDGPPPMGSNTVCTNGVCRNPYQCVADAQDNNNCFANTGQHNCQADKTCKTCASNADCGVLDGGRFPGQPKCQSDGTCGPCQVNADCPSAIPNCGSDGSCYDCRGTGEQCGAQDGGEVDNQQNCDTRNGICTNFCTDDDNCRGFECTPYCNIEKGCCVECTDDTHCPYSHWTDAEADKDTCHDSMCVVGVECWSDDDCGGDRPACIVSEHKCVECLFDEHCDGASPACSSSQQQCVECVFDSHCADMNTQDETFVCGSDQLCTSGTAALSLISASFMAVLAVFALF